MIDIVFIMIICPVAEATGGVVCKFCKCRLQSQSAEACNIFEKLGPAYRAPVGAKNMWIADFDEDVIKNCPEKCGLSENPFSIFIGVLVPRAFQKNSTLEV